MPKRCTYICFVVCLVVVLSGQSSANFWRPTLPSNPNAPYYQIGLTSLMLVFSLFYNTVNSAVATDQEQIQKRGHQQCSLCEIKAMLIAMDKKISAIKTAAVGKTCADLRKNGHTKDGIYTIDPDGLGSFSVRCDMTTAGGGWTIFQRRLDGSVNFYRGWKDYKHGFGGLNGEFWLGLDKIHRMTKNSKDVLRVDMQDTSGNHRYAQYNFFAISNETSNYQLNLGTYSGNAGNSLSYGKGMAFSTKDRDHDTSGGNCAVAYKGAWWYKACHASNLNGHYYLGAHKSYADGVNWYAWKGHYYSLKKTEMKIRPVGY